MEEKETVQIEATTPEQTTEVKNPTITTSSDGFVCAEAGPIMEVVTKEEKKENFFVKNKTLIGGITAAVLTIVMLAIVFVPRIFNMAVPNISSSKKINDSVSSSSQLISVLKLESGSELPKYTLFFNNSKEIANTYEVKYYLEGSELTLDDVSEEDSGKRYLKGTNTYTIKLVSKNETLTTKLEVVDTEKPSVVLKTINVNYGEEYNPKDFVNQYDDNSREYAFTVNFHDESQKKFRESGKHTVTISICDTSNNCLEQRGTVIVGDKSLALSGTKEQKIVVKTEELKYGIKKVTYVNVIYNIYKDGSTEELRRGAEEVTIDQSGFNGTVKDMVKEMLENYASYNSSRQTILNQTNAYRKEANLKELELDESLSKVATLRAMELAYSGSFSHTRPNGSEWTTIWEEYNGKERTVAMAENIAGDFESDTEVCERWHLSKSHNTIMLEPRFTKIGIGKYTYNGKTYWVQHFSE